VGDTTLKIVTAIHTCLNTATQGETLNALANNAHAVSNVTGDFPSRANLDLFGDFELLVDVAVSVAAGKTVAELWILPKVDNTNFPSGGAAGDNVDPQLSLRVGAFPWVITGTADNRMVLNGIRLPPHDLRFVLKNVSAQAFGSNDGHTLKLQAYRVTTA